MKPPFFSPCLVVWTQEIKWDFCHFSTGDFATLRVVSPGHGGPGLRGCLWSVSAHDGAVGLGRHHQVRWGSGIPGGWRNAAGCFGKTIMEVSKILWWFLMFRNHGWKMWKFWDVLLIFGWLLLIWGDFYIDFWLICWLISVDFYDVDWVVASVFTFLPIREVGKSCDLPRLSGCWFFWIDPFRSI